MRASLIFSSTSHSINVQKVCYATIIPLLYSNHSNYLPFFSQLKHIDQYLNPQIFKIVLSKAFDLKCTIPEIENVGEPLLLYQSVG
jgi:GTP-binding protein of the ras superfamily involved in termination of M-phase